MKPGKLFLIPSLIGSGDPKIVLSKEVIEIISQIRYFIVENQKNGIRLLVGCGLKEMIDECEFGILNEHTNPKDYGFLMEPLLSGADTGIISDAGCPAIADPGAEIVTIAHQRSIEVVPLTGPSSILLALIGSGLNGQSFAFHGYLPVKPDQRVKRIRELEKTSKQLRQTQIAIEAPYRNNQLMKDLLRTLHRDTRLCVASNLMEPDQLLSTQTVSRWNKNKPDLHKKPTVFLFIA